MTTQALVDGLATGATPCGAPPLAGMKVVGRDPLPPGIRATADLLIFETFAGDFYDPLGWFIGDRQVVMLSRFGAFGNVRSVNQRATLIGKRGKNPGIWIKPGAGFDLMENVTVENSRASMILKQEKGGVAKVIRRNHTFGQSQDVFKVSGGNKITENRIGLGVKRTAKPHSDVLTAIDGKGGIDFGYNHVTHGYAGADDAGTNDWGRIEAYWPGAVMDQIDIHDNWLDHENPASFGLQITEKNTPKWVGGVGFFNNRIRKAGGLGKILYAPSPRINKWSGNVDVTTGRDIPISAA